MTHLIKTVVIDAVADRADKAFSLQHRLSALFYKIMLPEIQQVLDELVPQDHWIYLDQLEVQFENMDPDEMEKKGWPEKFKEGFRRQLKEVIRQPEEQRRNSSGPFTPARQWIFYMQHGYLPWNVREPGEPWLEKVLEDFASNYTSIELLRKLIQQFPGSVQRMVRTHKEEYLTGLVETLTSKSQASLAKTIQRIQQYIIAGDLENGTGSDPRAFKYNTWQQIFFFVVQEKTHAAEEDITGNIILKNVPLRKLQQLISAEKNGGDVAPVFHLLEKEARQRIPGQKRLEPVKEPEPSVPDTRRKKENEIQEDGIFIKNAGLVLLHPFLNTLFSILKLTAGGKFIGVPEQQKAMVLLHYISAGRIDYKEHELVLNKILCGYALESFVEPEIKLTQDEINEADSLMEAVIREWPVLKNTGKQALRETFLQRNGKVMKTPGGEIKILVEAQAPDVLLDHLPWSVSIIKFSWMPQILRVDWR